MTIELSFRGRAVTLYQPRHGQLIEHTIGGNRVSLQVVNAGGRWDLQEIASEPTLPIKWGHVFREIKACPFRGKSLRFEPNKLCGCRGAMEEVFSCSLHGECSTSQFESVQSPRVCLTCEDRPALPLTKRVAWKPTQDLVSPQRKRLVVTIAVGQSTQELFELTKPLMQQYAERCDADFVALTDQTQDWWGLEKFRVLPFAKAYEQTLFLDADVIVQPHACNIFTEFAAAEVAIHDDWPYLPTRDWLEAESADVLSSQQVRPYPFDRCLNTGVVLCRQSRSNIWTPPPKALPTSHCAEQIWIDHQAGDCDWLDSRWNWQWWMSDFRKGVNEAYFVHLANAANKLKAASDLSLVNNGRID